MPNDVPKRRGCPKGGWPSQIKKKELLAAKSSFIVPPVEPGKPQYAFTLEQETAGENLYRAVMLVMQGDVCVEKKYVSAADFKRNTMHRILYFLTQIYCNDRMPETLDFLPSQGHASHG